MKHSFKTKKVKKLKYLSQPHRSEFSVRVGRGWIWLFIFVWRAAPTQHILPNIKWRGWIWLFIFVRRAAHTTSIQNGDDRQKKKKNDDGENANQNELKRKWLWNKNKFNNKQYSNDPNTGHSKTGLFCMPFKLSNFWMASKIVPKLTSRQLFTIQRKDLPVFR